MGQDPLWPRPLFLSAHCPPSPSPWPEWLFSHTLSLPGILVWGPIASACQPGAQGPGKGSLAGCNRGLPRGLTPRPAPLPRALPFLDCPLSLVSLCSCSPRLSPASLAGLRISQQRWPYLHLGKAWQLLGHLQGHRHLRRGQMGFVTRYSLRSHEPPLGSGVREIPDRLLGMSRIEAGGGRDGMVRRGSIGQEEGSREPLTIFGCFSSCSWGHTWGDGEHDSSEISLPSQSCPLLTCSLFTICPPTHPSTIPPPFLDPSFPKSL